MGYNYSKCASNWDVAFMVFLLAALTIFPITLYAQDTPEEERLRQLTRKVDNWILSQALDFTGQLSITLNCGDRLITIICDETRRWCGPNRRALQEAFKEECQQHLIKFYGLEKPKKQKGKRRR